MTNTFLNRLIPGAAFLAMAISTGAVAVPEENTDRVEETIEVKRAEEKDTKHPSLRFLKDHRVFLRARLDLLRLQIRLTRTEDAEMIDARLLRLQEMAAAIAAARDTVGAVHGMTPQRELLTSEWQKFFREKYQRILSRAGQ